MNTGVIDQFLNTFTQYIDTGFGLLGGEVAFLATTLTTIDVTLAALFWAWSAGEEIIAHLIKKTLYVGFFALLIGNFKGFAKIIYDSFSGLGLKAAGSALTADQLLHPGKIAQVGIDAGQPILQAASNFGYSALWPPNLLQILVLYTAWIAVIISFFILAIQLFVTLIEFKLTTLVGFLLVPFGLFGKTAFLAERVLGNVIASGVKVLVLAVIVGIGTGLFGQFTQGVGGNQPTSTDVLGIALAALALLGLGIFGPGIATGLMAGAPQLSAGAAVGTASAGIAIASTPVQIAYGPTKPFAQTAFSKTYRSLSGPGSSSANNGNGGSAGRSSEPSWAQALRQSRQALTRSPQVTAQGIARVAREIRSGDSRGGSTSVNLR